MEFDKLEGEFGKQEEEFGKQDEGYFGRERPWYNQDFLKGFFSSDALEIEDVSSLFFFNNPKDTDKAATWAIFPVLSPSVATLSKGYTT
uniref:Uncharacterized protein n=1 Tax=Solanum tuberosum TaxID=4113 RepID=M1D9A3_SOLTU